MATVYASTVQYIITWHLSTLLVHSGKTHPSTAEASAGEVRQLSCHSALFYPASRAGVAATGLFVPLRRRRGASDQCVQLTDPAAKVSVSTGPVSIQFDCIAADIIAIWVCLFHTGGPNSQDTLRA